MTIELEREGIPFVSQSSVKVFYDGKIVGEYFADLLVDGKVIVEIKAARTMALEYEAQLLNYLKATNIEVGLLLNFGPKPQVKRRVFDNFRRK
jgi:GxxExxY protein